MKQIYAMACVLFLALALVAPFTTSAQPAESQPVNRPSNLTKHVVADGETLSGQAGNNKLQNEANWRQLLAWNPTVGDPGRFKVLINGQKKPVGFEEAMTYLREAPIFFYWKKPQEFWGLQELGFQISNNQTPATATVHTSEVIESVIIPNPQPTSNFNWLWVLLIWLAIAAFAVYALRRWGWPWYVKNHRMNPTTAGVPQIRGGVQPEQAADVFLRREVATYSGTGGIESFRIIRVDDGTGHGALEVFYGDGKSSIRMLKGERMYRALVELPDGRREERYMMQACGNDIRFTGLSYKGGTEFEFRTVRAIPAPETVVLPTIQQPPQITREELVEVMRETFQSMANTQAEPTNELVVRRAANGSTRVMAGALNNYQFGDLVAAKFTIEPIIIGDDVVGFTLNGGERGIVIFRNGTLDFQPQQLTTGDPMDGQPAKVLTAGAGPLAQQ